jgi:hypothetical protein
LKRIAELGQLGAGVESKKRTRNRVIKNNQKKRKVRSTKHETASERIDRAAASKKYFLVEGRRSGAERVR